MALELQQAVIADVHVPGKSFGVVASPDERWLLVSVSAPPAHGIAVLRRRQTGAQLSQFVPLEHPALGLALTRGGEVLAVADVRGGVSFVAVVRAISGSRRSVLGHIQTGTAMGSVEVTLSQDEQYAFVTEEKRGAVSVIDLHRAQGSRYQASAVIGQVPVDHMPVGMALSPDGSWLYVTCEATEAAVGASVEGHASDFLARPVSPEGTLIVIDVARAQHEPAHAVIARVPAGKNPVRVALSHDGSIAWATARASNALLAFDAAALRKDPRSARRATFPVGFAPVGVALVAGDQIAVVANSNRFAGGDAAQTVSVLDTEAVLAGRPATLGTIQVGAFPREFGAAARGDTLFLTNFGSGTVTLIDAAVLRDALPRPPD